MKKNIIFLLAVLAMICCAKPVGATTASCQAWLGDWTFTYGNNDNESGPIHGDQQVQFTSVCDKGECGMASYFYCKAYGTRLSDGKPITILDISFGHDFVDPPIFAYYELANPGPADKSANMDYNSYEASGYTSFTYSVAAFPNNFNLVSGIKKVRVDNDHDGILDPEDNCPDKPNGPILGTCTASSDKAGVTCTSDADCVIGCSINGTCSMNQEDADADGKGDVCDNCNNLTGEGVKTTYYRDADSDSYGTSASTTQACTAPTGYVINSTDCNDSNAAVKPGATEACNGIDDNCDGQTDNGGPNIFYRDADNDTYGNAAVTIGSVCSSQPAGYVTNSGDCNDSQVAVHPGAADASCNGIDDDCDGLTDDGYVGVPTSCGVGVCARTGSTSCVSGGVVDSCKAGSPTTEVCNGKDDDCDGQTDESACSTTTTTTPRTGKDCDNLMGGTWTFTYGSGGTGPAAGSYEMVFSRTWGATTIQGESMQCYARGRRKNDLKFVIAALTATGAYYKVWEGADNTTMRNPANFSVIKATDMSPDYHNPTSFTIASTSDQGPPKLLSGTKTARTAFDPHDLPGIWEFTYDNATSSSPTCCGSLYNPNGTYRTRMHSLCIGTGTCTQGSDWEIHGSPTNPEIYAGREVVMVNSNAYCVPRAMYLELWDAFPACFECGLANSFGTMPPITTMFSDYFAVYSEASDAFYRNKALPDCPLHPAGNITKANGFGLVSARRVCKDYDNDTYGVGDCAGYFHEEQDCNDNDQTIYPGAADITCDGIDQNCDGTFDEGSGGPFATYYQDADSDGYGNTAAPATVCTGHIPAGYVTNSDDCDDNVFGQGLIAYYVDNDGDGYGQSGGCAVPVYACTQPAGYSGVVGDCDDDNNQTHPGATEVCNGRDDNCNGQIDDACVP